MQNPNNLDVYPLAFDLACGVYRITKSFPTGERFGLIPQMQRASVSVGSNIAEGCGRRTDAELCNFLSHSMGSASELNFQLELSKRLGFATAAELDSVLALDQRMQRMLSRLIYHLERTPRRR